MWPKNKKPRNKGLTKETDERVKKLSEKQQGHLQRNTGRTHFKKGNVTWCKGKHFKKGKIKVVRKICPVCHKEFLTYPSKNNTYCSRKCDGLSRRNLHGGKGPNYGYDWKENRGLALERDKYTCQVCFKKTNVNVHHIVPYRICKSNNILNLVTLCASCHRKSEMSTEKVIKISGVGDQFLEYLGKMWITHITKNFDYSGGDALSNLKMSEIAGISAWKGVLIRITDKVSRLLNFAKKESFEVKDESVFDTLKDLAVYAILCSILYSERSEKIKQKQYGGY
jgi:5-methylcytosine-specific restriction endonuclease McrA